LGTEFPDCAPIRAKFVREDRVFVEPARLFFWGFSMLVARRDPPLHVDARDAASPGFSGYPAPKASRLARFATVMQVTGSLLAIPIGIASAYSFYRANFSPETTCQSLRGNIVAMLDRSVDAATRRMLVRRDVEEFEKTCGTVDPDATAAFKTLLAVEKTAAPAAAAPSAPKAQRNESATKEPVRKAEPRPQAEPRSQAPKQPTTAAAPPVTEPVRRDAAISDTQWLDAVRQALVTHKEEVNAPAAPSRLPDVAKPQSAAVPTARPASRDAVLVPPATAVAPSAPPAAVPAVTPAIAPVPAPVAAPSTTTPPAPIPTPAPGPTAAPALPPAIAVGPPPSAVQATENHPVPPESIPDSTPPANAAKPDEAGRSRIGKWISAIPLLGPAVDNARH
jgi:hypothetical protein